MFRRYVLPYLLFAFYRLLSWSWRMEIIESDTFKEYLKLRKPLVMAHWHGDELVLVSLISRYRVAAMTSTSKDGELMNKLIELLGGKTARGSSTRGGASALKGLLKLVRSGYNPSVAVDGPKGPIYKAKPGVFEISRVIGCPIFPVAIEADRGFVFKKSWNQAYLPYPFAKIRVVWLEPMEPILREQDPRDPALGAELESSLHNAKQQARQLLIAGAKAEC